METLVKLIKETRYKIEMKNGEIFFGQWELTTKDGKHEVFYINDEYEYLVKNNIKEINGV